LLLPIVSLLAIVLFNNPVANSQNPTNPDQSSVLEEQLQIINSTLANYPAQSNSKYTESSRISINSKGKLMLYKQYQVADPCTAAREEVFLTDLEPSKISSFTKGNTMVITVGCKDNIGNCVQRFFRNSCDVTFKPESFQKELLIISSANLRNTEQLRIAFSQLIKIASNTLPQQTSLDNSNTNNLDKDSMTENTSTQAYRANPSLDLIKPSTEEKKKRALSLTMNDVEPARKVEKKKPKPSPKTNPNQTSTSEKLNQEDEDLDIDKLLDLLLKNE
jgi:hypothetical protein